MKWFCFVVNHIELSQQRLCFISSLQENILRIYFAFMIYHSFNNNMAIDLSTLTPRLGYISALQETLSK